MRLLLVCDLSGSMGEGEKSLILRTVSMTVAQWVHLGYGQVEIHLCAWACEARHIPNWSITDEFPADMLVCQGSASGAALVQLLDNMAPHKVLLLTDGFWPYDDAKALNCWQETLPADTLRAIQIGAAANPRLSKALNGAKVFSAEEIFAALDGWLESGGQGT